VIRAAATVPWRLSLGCGGDYPDSSLPSDRACGQCQYRRNMGCGQRYGEFRIGNLEGIRGKRKKFQGARHYGGDTVVTLWQPFALLEVRVPSGLVVSAKH